MSLDTRKSIAGAVFLVINCLIFIVSIPLNVFAKTGVHNIEENDLYDRNCNECSCTSLD